MRHLTQEKSSPAASAVVRRSRRSRRAGMGQDADIIVTSCRLRVGSLQRPCSVLTAVHPEHQQRRHLEHHPSIRLIRAWCRLSHKERGRWWHHGNAVRLWCATDRSNDADPALTKAMPKRALVRCPRSQQEGVVGLLEGCDQHSVCVCYAGVGILSAAAEAIRSPPQKHSRLHSRPPHSPFPCSSSALLRPVFCSWL